MKSKITGECRSTNVIWVLIVVIVIILFSSIASVNAGMWRDDFENDSFDGWARTGIKECIWTVQDGFLHAQIPGRDPCADFLEFAVSPGPYKQFTVTLINPSTNMRIGLAKKFPPDVRFYSYTFTAHGISTFRISPGGGPFVSGFGGRLPRNPGTIWDGGVVELKVHFDAGRFQYFADGSLRADFEDTDFEQIDMISILFIGGDGVKESMVDAFEVSGPRVLAVQPKEKLVISWGEIKNHSLLKRG